MRLDKYLKVSRLIKRRTVANEACDNARISVNGKPQRRATTSRSAIRSRLPSAHERCAWRFLPLPEAVRKDDASAMYKEI